MNLSLTPPDRLDFSLPDFTRISWVSEHARQIWEPRLESIRRAWFHIEWLSVLAGVRQCSLTGLSLKEFINATALWTGHGLSALPLQIEGASNLTYSNTARTPESGKPIILSIAVGPSEVLTQFKEAWDSGDNELIGTMLGYPPCCRNFFQRVWVEEKFIDTTWAMATNTVAPSNRIVTIEVREPSLANILWRWMGVRAVPHLPCRFDCAATVEIGKKLLQVGRQAGYLNEVEWIEQILSWPVEWSGLHGIAEVKTPLLKVSTCTDATAKKYIVRWSGTGYPDEGATGITFPYRSPARLFTTNSNAYQRGLDNVIQAVAKAPQPDWYYLDNGFSSFQNMDLLHEPIVTKIHKELKSLQGNIIDLGCGNGALLKKICEGHDGLIPYGIDTNATVLDHARKLLPSFAENFIRGDFFDVGLWAHHRHYELAILMVGRLLEVSRERSQELITALHAQCNLMLLYVYPGRGQNNLELLAQKTWFNLRKNNGETEGIVKFNQESSLTSTWIFDPAETPLIDLILL